MAVLKCSPAPDRPVSPTATLIGQSKEALLACAGRFNREVATGGGVVLKYYQEAPMFEESFMGSKSSHAGTHHGCWANVSLLDNRIIGIEFKSVPTPGSADDHCEDIFEPCILAPAESP